MVMDLISSYVEGLFNSVPTDYRILISLLLYTFFIAMYAVFIWKFYKFLASKEILQLNLRQYNHSSHPFLEKFLAVVLYTIEYLVILPFLVLFWFTILSLFLLLLSKQGAQQILLVSAAIIASTRITAYISEDLAKDLAKILPFTVLAIFLLDPDFFNIVSLLEKMGEIPSLFNNILMFIVFIFAIEFILRGLYSIKQFFNSGAKDSGGKLEEASKENLEGTS